MKKIALLTDISALGNCSGSANIAVLSALGFEPCLLPTAVLSAQTGFSGHTFFALESEFKKSCDSVVSICPRFEAVYIGFVTSAAQLKAASRFARHYKALGAAVVLDPIIGDGGERFRFVDDALLEDIRVLAGRCDVITPNVTEFCLLCGAGCSEISALPDDERIEKLSAMCEEYIGGSGLTVVITGIPCGDDIGVIVGDSECVSVFKEKRFGGSYSGTGDIFTSMICAAAADGRDIHKAAQRAARVIGDILKRSVDDITDRNFGIPFQEYISETRFSALNE